MRCLSDPVSVVRKRALNATTDSKILPATASTSMQRERKTSPTPGRGDVDPVGTNVRSAFTGDTFAYNSDSRCARLTDATLIRADLEGRFFDRSSYGVLMDNMGGV